MLIIPIKEGENIDRALKRFKRKFDKTGTKRSLQTRKEFLKPSIQKGTVILFDDYLYYKGSISKGECGAFMEFQKKNPQIKFRRSFDYGYCGRAFIAYQID